MLDTGSFSFRDSRKSENIDSEFQIQYAYIPSPNGEDQLAQAWDIILNLVMDDLQSELAKQAKGESC